MRLLRSYLFAPGNNEDLLAKVFEAGADAVVLDLEDAVPESEKGHARSRVAATLDRKAAQVQPARYRPAEVFVRLNGLGSSHWRSDVDAVIGPGLAGVRVPKAEDIESFCRLNDALSDRERALGLPLASIRVVATIETARGVCGLESIARAPRLFGFAFGAADFGADVAADPTDATSTLFARSRLVVVSKAMRLLAPIASVFTHLSDLDGLLTDTERQKRLGFFGRSVIHPQQLPIVHRVFDPGPEEVQSARRVVATHEAAGREGRGAIQSDGVFIDAAVARRARAIIELAEYARQDRS